MILHPTQQQQLHKLVTLLTYSDQGAFAVALYDRVATRHAMLQAIHAQVERRVYEVTLTGSKRNPIDAIRNLQTQPGEVVCLYDIERAFPDALGYLDLQREVLADLDISLVVWVNHYEYRELATNAPNFYAFRTSTFDFTNPAEIPVTEPLFVGREPDLETLRGLIDKGDCVTLTGYGGVGKSTLALQLSRQMRSRFQETVWVNCETRPLLGDILLQVAVVLMGEGMRQIGPDEQRKRLAKALCERPCLIILDNFESVGEDTDLLHWLKTVSAPSAVLLTSRQQVPELDAPNYSLPELPPNEAIEMFTLRARLAGWQGEEADVIPRLCELIGNLPLAIELLAARADELPLPQLLEEIGKSLNALVSGDDPLRAERHQSIAACFRVSFDRLSDTAQELLKRLSILPDGASEQIIADFINVQDWQKPIEECIAHSMLEFDGKRYRFHPLVRRFTLTQIDNSVNQWRSHLVSFFFNLIGKDNDVHDARWRYVLDQEWQNAGGTIEVAEQIHDWEAVVKLTIKLHRFLMMRGLWSEAERHILCAIKVVGTSLHPEDEARLLMLHGEILEHRKQWESAACIYNRALSIAKSFRSLTDVGTVLTSLCFVHTRLRQWDKAEKAVQESLMLAKVSGSPSDEAGAFNVLGNMYLAQNRFAVAEDAFKKSLMLFQEIGDQINYAVSLLNLGILYASRKQWQKADKHLREGLSITRLNKNYVDMGKSLYLLARVNKAKGDVSQAFQFAEEALQACSMTEDQQQQAEVRKFIIEL